MNTIKLTEKMRDDLKSLLEDHQNVTDALDRIKRATATRILTIANEDGSDFSEVPLGHALAKRTLTAQKEWIEGELKKLGVAV